MSGGVLLGAGARPHRLELIVPREYADSDIVGRCLVPGCGARFYRGEEQAWQRHVGECARRNMDAIRDVIDARLPVFESFDPEVETHMRKVGRRMLQEGRLEVKPNERAGFS